MAITKSDIDNVSLNVVDEGYDPEEVDVLLERVAEEVDALNRALADAQSRVEAAENRARAAEQQILEGGISAQSAQASEQAAASERQIAQVLISAQKSADEVRETAKGEAEKVYREAEQRARDIVRDALSEKQRIIDEVERLRESTERFRSEYISMLSRFTGDAQKVMPSLENSAPNVSVEKRKTEEAVKVLRDGDAAYAAPEPEPAAPEIAFSAEPVVASAPVASAPAASVFDDPIDLDLSDEMPIVAPAAAPAAQASFGFDDDLDIDIEEID